MYGSMTFHKWNPSDNTHPDLKPEHYQHPTSWPHIFSQSLPMMYLICFFLTRLGAGVLGSLKICGRHTNFPSHIFKISFNGVDTLEIFTQIANSISLYKFLLILIKLTLSDLVMQLSECILFVVCSYCALTAIVYQRFREGQVLLGSVCEPATGKNVSFFWENLKCRNKRLQSIVDHSGFGHLNLHFC